ncbi:LOW QUALITY PROTEIN: prepronociceptin [Motacilla alba alba]|uniref:LOW QUALITY PROTEIN: prepronociceptin n=1 Tax=Motacilla alba alba TaxID=1094192 RepID=UPI0018D52420|nr:LOW QUALITY PROTEIN: prepronociceptin [Motacilla alba alba]
MRAVLWDLLLLWLCARARSDCRGDCLHCDRQLYRDSFDVLICILECEGQAVPRATWELCAAAGRAAPRPRRLSGRPWPSGEARLPTPSGAAPGAWARPGREEDEEEEEDISRRPGAGRAAKGVQKRYGGFIGVRKSARKWNNQKRFSEFLKQYLGMAPRSSEYGRGGAGDANEI